VLLTRGLLQMPVHVGTRKRPQNMSTSIFYLFKTQKGQGHASRPRCNGAMDIPMHKSIAQLGTTVDVLDHTLQAW